MIITIDQYLIICAQKKKKISFYLYIKAISTRNLGYGKINVISVSDDKCANEIVNLDIWIKRNVPNLLDICNYWEWFNDNNCSGFSPISKIFFHFP